MASLIEPPKTMKATRLSVLNEADIRYREEREGIVRNSIRQGIAAAKALQEIHTYRDGALWKADHRSFESYLQDKWGIQKSQGYRLLDFGRFMCELKTDFSPKGENLPDPESPGQVRPLLELVPEEHQVECWNQITSGTTPAKLTSLTVHHEAEKFLLSKGLKPKGSKPAKPTKAGERESATRDVAKLRASLARLPQPERFESLLQCIQTLIDQDLDDEPIPVEAAEVLTRDRNDPAPAAHSECNVHAEAKVSLVSQQVECDITVESVAETMNAVAPPHKSNTATATAKPEKKTSANRARLSATEAQDDTDPPGSMNEASMTDFMSAPLYHAAFYPYEEYDKWLAETANSHPVDIRTPNDGGVARISVIRAKQLAFESKVHPNGHLLKLILDVENSAKDNRGAFADALFEKHSLEHFPPPAGSAKQDATQGAEIS